MRRAAPAIAALALAGCGTPSHDLFVVERSGEIPGARLTLLVTDDGTVRCNDSERRQIGSERLLDARELARDLAETLERRRSFPPRRNTVLSYRVEVEDGTIAFADSSRPLPHALLRLQGFTRDIAKRVCGLAR